MCIGNKIRNSIDRRNIHCQVTYTCGSKCIPIVVLESKHIELPNQGTLTDHAPFYANQELDRCGKNEGKWSRLIVQPSRRGNGPSEETNRSLPEEEKEYKGEM